MIRFRCPTCNQLLGIAQRKAGTQVTCPKCGRSLVVPSHEQKTDRPVPGALVSLRQQQPGRQLAPHQTLLAPVQPASQHQAFHPHSGFECISLASLMDRMEVYERLPLLIQSTLRRSVVVTVVMNLIFIPVLWLCPSPEWALSPVSSDGFFLWFTADVVNFLLNVAYVVAPFLLVLNLASLLLTLVVLILSWGMTKPVDEAIHWLAWTAAFPSGATTLSTAFWTLLFVAIVVTTVVIWIVIICVVIAIIVGILTALAQG